jgi:peptidoglycan/LPS O-acetylase OafA/YrhL
VGGAAVTGAAHTTPDVVAPPPGNPRFPLVDSLRAIAVGGVLLTHVFVFSHVVERHSWGAFPGNLSVGVTLFFLISGFLLYRPFFNAELNGTPRPGGLQFAWRRVLRIVPAYWLALTVLAIYPGIPDVFTEDWWRYYFFLQVYDKFTAAQGIGIAWSLCVEMTFYLLLPFYALATARLARTMSAAGRVRFQLGLLAVLGLASIVLRYLDQSVVMQISLPTHLYWFTLGMAFAVISVAMQAGHRPPSIITAAAARPTWCWVAAAVLFTAMCLPLGSAPLNLYYNPEQEAVQYVLSGLLAACIMLPAVFGDPAEGRVRRILAWRTLAWVGLVSYGIYLWHTSVALELVDHGFTRWWQLLVPTVAITLAIAAASYYALERPILRYKNLRLPRLGGAGPAPGRPRDRGDRVA